MAGHPEKGGNFHNAKGTRGWAIFGIGKLQAASDLINQRFADLKAILRTVSRPNLNKKIKQSF